MRKIFGWIGVLSGLILAVVICFGLYAHFLVDYSLESLEAALSASARPEGEVSSVSHQVYRNMLQGIAVAEAFDWEQEQDFQNTVLLELAARSFDEVHDRAGQSRAQLYLGQTLQARQMERGRLFLLMDRAHEQLQKLYRQGILFMNYIQRRFMKKPEEEMDVSSYLLISQAEERERRWELDRAADLYRRFLEIYPDHPEHAFVAISLGQVLIKQKRYYEAERLLRGVMAANVGMEEYQIAGGLLRKISEMKRRETQISRIEREMEGVQDPVERERAKLRLGLLHLSSYGLEPAQAILRGLEDAQDGEVRQKAKFYLGWIYKLQAQYDQGAALFLELREQDDLWMPARMGVRAQLADIYYQKNEPEKALSFYEEISTLAGSLPEAAERASRDAWATLAGSERATMYYFDLRDPLKAREALGDLLDDFASQDLRIQADLPMALEAAMERDLRDLAFMELRRGRVYEAYRLFKKKIQREPGDGWARAGLASVYVLLTEIDKADEEAQEAYSLSRDSYTASVKAYVRTYQSQYDEAERLYKEAIAENEEYVPAVYNLGGVLLLKGEAEEALEFLEKARDLLPSGGGSSAEARVLNNMGYAWWSKGNSDQALRYFKEALTIQPGFEAARTNLTQIERGRSLAQPDAEEVLL